mmetsp:Transcript_12122/g.26761  ORF Transcript_12122/g.26761 Transcript_12122/m.26761 type:complete len:299 (-) Transcript_12122:421-1317(-)
MDITGLTILNGSDLFVQLQCCRANLFAIIIFDFGRFSVAVLLKSRDAAHRCDDNCCSHCQNFVQTCQFLKWNFSFLDIITHVTCHLHERFVCNRRQNRGRFWCNESLVNVVNSHKVAGTEFFHLCLRGSIQIQANLVSLLLGKHIRKKVGSVVSCNLDMTNPTRRGSVKVIDNQAVHRRCQSSLVVITHRNHHDQKCVFVGGLQSNAGSRTKEQGTNVERTSTTIGWYVFNIIGDGLFDSIDKGFRRQFGHHDSSTTGLHAFGIFFWSKHVDLAVFVTECFQTFKASLSIVQGCSANV